MLTVLIHDQLAVKVGEMVADLGRGGGVLARSECRVSAAGADRAARPG